MSIISCVYFVMLLQMNDLPQQIRLSTFPAIILFTISPYIDIPLKPRRGRHTNASRLGIGAGIGFDEKGISIQSKHVIRN